MVSSVEVSEIKAIAFDLDGVIYLGEHLVPSADKLLNQLKEQHVDYYFITNNSTKTREEIALKLNRLGICADHEKVYSSAYLSGRFIRELHDESIPSVYVIGSHGLVRELQDAGIKVATCIEDSNILLVGYDVSFNYQKILQGFDVLLRDATFIVCNLETRFPIEGGRWKPGCISMVASIEASSGRKPDHIVGKPNTFMLESVARDHSLSPGQILVVGDTPESDILMANKFGSPSALFIPENSNNEQLLQLEGGYAPSFFIEDHQELITLFAKKQLH